MFNPKLTITNKINNLMPEIKRASGFLRAAKRKSGLEIGKFRASETFEIFENVTQCILN